MLADIEELHMVFPGFRVGGLLDSAVMFVRRTYGKGIPAGVSARWRLP